MRSHPAAVLLVIIPLAGCVQEKILTRVVEIPGPTRYIALPDALLSPCKAPDTSSGSPATNGELLLAYGSQQLMLAQCAEQLQRIRTLQAESLLTAEQPEGSP